MNQELQKNELVCLLLKNGLEVWMEKEKAILIQKELADPNSTGNFFEILDCGLMQQSIYNIEGWYFPVQLAKIKHIKSGGWICKEGNKHSRGEKCECESEEEEMKRKSYDRLHHKYIGWYPSCYDSKKHKELFFKEKEEGKNES